MPLREVGVGARQHQQHVGAAAQGAPALGAVQPPAALGAGGLEAHAGHVAAVVGLGHRHRRQLLAARELRQPVGALLLGAAGQQGARDDLGPRDQRAGRAQRAARQLFGDHDHVQRVVKARAGLVGREAAEALRDRQAEGAELDERVQDLVGHVGVVAVDVFGRRLHHLLGELSEGLAHHLGVGREQAASQAALLRADEVAEASQVVGRQLDVEEVEGGGRVDGRGQEGALEPEVTRVAREAGARVLHGLCGERQGQPLLEQQPLGPVGRQLLRRAGAVGVADQRLGGGQLGGAPRELEGHELRGVEAGVRQLAVDAHARLQRRQGGLDGGGRQGHGGHAGGQAGPGGERVARHGRPPATPSRRGSRRWSGTSGRAARRG